MNDEIKHEARCNHIKKYIDTQKRYLSDMLVRTDNLSDLDIKQTIGTIIVSQMTVLDRISVMIGEL